MPFDGIDGFDNHPMAKLGAVERMLATEQQWCKGRLRDAHGRHCLVGAIEAVGGRQLLQKPILQAAREVSGKRYWRIEFFNDDPRTTQPRHQRWIRAFLGVCSRCGPAADARLREASTRFSVKESYDSELEGSARRERVLELQH